MVAKEEDMKKEIICINNATFRFEPIPVTGQPVNIVAYPHRGGVDLLELTRPERAALEVAAKETKKISFVSIFQDGEWKRVTTKYAKGCSRGYLVANAKSASRGVGYATAPSKDAVMRLVTPNAGIGALTDYWLDRWVTPCPGHIFDE